MAKGNPKISGKNWRGGRKKGKQLPHLWQYQGIEREQHLAWVRMKAQCSFRNEDFDLSFEDFKTVWEKNWHRRGRTNHSVCIHRVDDRKPWAFDNVALIDRNEHFKITAQRRVESMALARA